MAREEGLLSTTVETIWQACVLLIGLFLAFVAWGTRSLWRPVIDALLAGVDSPRNIPLVGRCCACLCPCAVAQYHPPFRLRVVVHGGWRLRRPPDLGASSDPMQCYVVLRCGVNPPKTTCVQPVPVGIYLSDRNPVMWDDVLDVEVRVSDDVLVLEVVDCTLEPPEHVVGRVDLSIAEIYSDLSGELGSEGVMSAELVTRKLMHLSKEAGEINFSLYATEPGQPLPPLARGMSLRPGTAAMEERATLTETLSTAWPWQRRY